MKQPLIAAEGRRILSAQAWLRSNTGYILLMADQAIVSGTNFFMSFAVARSCSKAEFGLYVLAVSIQMALREVQIGLVTGPLAFLGAMESDREFADYITPLIPYQVLVGLIVSLAAWIAGEWYALTSAGASFVMIARAAALALFFVQVQEFFRRTLMARLLFRRALVNDFLYSLLQITAVSSLLLRHKASSTTLSPVEVFQWAAAAGFIATCYGYWQIRTFISLPLRWNVDSIRKNWHFGKWNLASSGLGVGYQQAIYLLLGAVAGASEVATIEAPRLLVAPFTVLLMGWNNVVGPSAARIFERSGIEATQAFLHKTTRTLLIAIALVISPLMLFPRLALSHLVGSRYADQPWLLRTWGVTVLFMALSSGLACVLFVARTPHRATFVRLASSCVGLPATIILTLLFRAQGAACARLIAEGTQALGAFIAARRLEKQLQRTDVRAAA